MQQAENAALAAAVDGVFDTSNTQDTYIEPPLTFDPSRWYECQLGCNEDYGDRPGFRGWVGVMRFVLRFPDGKTAPIYFGDCGGGDGKWEPEMRAFLTHLYGEARAGELMREPPVDWVAICATETVRVKFSADANERGEQPVAEIELVK
jgi:hypothetical protein